MKRLFSSLIGTLAMYTALSANAGAVTITLMPVNNNQQQPPPVVVNTRSCPTPYADATVAGVLYDKPSIAQEMDISGTTTLFVRIDREGRLSSAAMHASSGNIYLDLAAMRSARTAMFTPQIANCERVASAYLYSVEY